MNTTESRSLFASVKVARLATTDAGGRPHLVPIAFALLGDDTIVSAVDHKPKRTTALRRLANVAENPSVAVLVDHYDDDWEQLWWARADGLARVLASPLGGTRSDPDAALRAAALDALAARYEQYRERPPNTGPMLAIAVTRWSGWRASRAAVDPARP